MVLQAQLMTVEEFERFVYLPANVDKLFEYIGGEIVEVPSNAYVSEIAGEILFLIKLHLREQNIEGHVTGEAGGYQIAGDRYAPDVAYLPTSKQAELDKLGYNSVPPDLAVEVVSSDRNNELDQLRIKITNYHAVGTTVWVVKPDNQQIEVHPPGQAVSIYRQGDTLEGGDVLPEFKLSIADLFEEENKK